MTQSSLEKSIHTRTLLTRTQLGIPTANIPVDTAPWIESQPTGVYFGFAGIKFPASHPNHPSNHNSCPAHPSHPVPESKRAEGWGVYPMVMSIGFNPFYKNTVRSAEVHVLHPFKEDFYGAEMCLSLLGYVRPELDYVSKEALIEDINEDCEVAQRSLARKKWEERKNDSYLWGEEERKL